MMKLIVATALFAVLAVSSVRAAEKAIAMGECSTLWRTYKASPEYVDPGKGNRSAAWQSFYKQRCGKDRDAN